MKFRSSRQFIIYYFNNILELGCNDFNWKPAERVNEMRGLINIYRESFRLNNYSDIQIWKRIKKLYYRDWCELHYEMMEYEKQNKD